MIAHSVITALVAVIHRSTSVIYLDNSTLVEPWITGTSPVMTTFMGSPLKQQQPISLTGQQCNKSGNDTVVRCGASHTGCSFTSFRVFQSE